MAFFLDEQAMVEDNIFKYENRINSPLTRFLDKSPTFTTYYHINVNETTIDDGFRDIESIIGNRSPLRFQKIDNFPIYGLEAVILNIQDNEQGLDTEYTGEGVILPNTIKPLQNDFFLIKHVKKEFIFRIIEIAYDSIRPDNFYKISFRLEWIDQGKEEELENQVEEKYTCILQNIGSENNCIIQDEYLEQLNKVDTMYSDMVNTYKSIFYSERYNCFLGEKLAGYKIFDPLQSVFINKHKLMNKKNDFNTLVLSEGYTDNRRKIKYEKSIYRFFERRDVKLIGNFSYALIPAIYKKDSSFSRWNDQSIQIADIPNSEMVEQATPLFTEDIIDCMRYNGENPSKYVDLMQRFIRKENLTIYDIPLDLNEELLRLDANEEVFFFTPILMYVIQTIVSEFLSTKK